MMKKLLLFVTLASSLFMLAGCEFNEVSQEYRDLRHAYDRMIEDEIVSTQNLADFINHATLETSLSNVKITVAVYENNTIIETRYGAGVVFASVGAHAHILTTYGLLEVTEGTNILVKVHDYLNREHMASVRVRAEEDQMGIIRIISPLVNPLPVVTMALQLPFAGEQVLLIGFQNQVINAMSMGRILALPDDTQDLITTNVPTDIYGMGGMLVNTSHELVGIQIGVDPSTQTVIAQPLERILALLEQYDA